MLNLTNSRVDVYRTALALSLITNSYVLKRVDAGDGTSAVDKATGAPGEDLVGIAHVTPIAATVRPVVEQRHIVDSANKIELDYPLEIATSIRVIKADGNDVPTADVTATAGSREVEVANVAPNDVLYVSYLRSVSLAELSTEGLPMDFANSVNGAGGACEFATGNSNVEVDFFDTSVSYEVGAPVYANADGMLTATAADADSPVFGRVSIAPSAGYPILGVAFSLAF